MKRRGRGWLLLWMVLGAAAAIYSFDPLTDLIQRGRRAAFGPPEPERPSLAPTIRVVLFFPGAEADLLARYPAEVEEGKDPVQTARNVLAALLEGPRRPGFAPAVPAGTRLRAAVPGPEGTLFVDLSRALREAHPGGAWSELLTAQAVANTVVFNFPKHFEQVVLLVEGQEAETIAGTLSLYEPLRFREDLVAREGEAPAPAGNPGQPPAPAKP
ncbi:MAG: GerMN domain-containing protein [Nitrospinota bacterium]